MAEYTQEQVDVNDLVVGMYIARLDRPWVETPYPIQGFHIQNLEDIRTISTYCKHVYVDVSKSKVEVNRRVKIIDVVAADTSSFVDLKVNEEKYEKKKTLKQEIGTASNLHHDISVAIDEIMNSLLAGKPLALPATQKIADKMVSSIARNPDAFTWISRIRDKDAYAYSHSVRASIWAITFGRHLGLYKQRLENLAIGVLLAEVGKTKLPSALLTKKDPLSDEEFKELKKHVQYGVDILKETKGTNEDMLTVVRCIHERHNGTGYPKGLQGSQIPLLGKIAGIVDFYDVITTPRNNKMASSSAEAMVKLHGLRNEDFQSELVDEFIQAIGIYPTGTLIELSTGEVGVITEQNLNRRLRPKILLILDSEKNPIGKNKEIDLLTEVKDAGGNSMEISRSLPEGAYGIDLTKFRKNIVSRLLGMGSALFRH